MIADNRLASFRIDPHAIRSIFGNEQESRQTGGLPSNAFNWRFDGLVRTEVIAAKPPATELSDWIERCAQLDIEPVLVLAAKVTVLEDELVDALIGLGATVLEVGSAYESLPPDKQAADDSKWNVESLISMPDKPVVEAYYSSATARPRSAWPLQGDIEFWTAYGAAIQRWTRSDNRRLHSLGNLYFERWPSILKVELRDSDVQAVTDSELLTECYSADGKSRPEKAVCARRLPFVYDLLRNGTWQSFGRLPGLELGLESAHAEQFSDLGDRAVRIMMNWFARFQPNILMPGQNLATHFGDINRLIAELSMRGPFGAPPDVAPSIFDLVVIASEHDSFKVRLEAVGRLSVEDTRWSVIIPRVPLLRNFAQACSVQIEGLIDPSTNAPAVKEIVLPAVEGDEYPFGTIEATIAVDGFRPASDDLLGPLITLILEGRRIDCMVRPS